MLDASAALHLLVREEGPSEIGEILRQTPWVLAPSLFGAELANGLWKLARAGELGGDGLLDWYEAGLGLVSRLEPDQPLLGEALSLARHLDHPVYDLLYGVLAMRQDCPVVTLDRRLAAVLSRIGVEAILPA